MWRFVILPDPFCCHRLLHPDEIRFADERICGGIGAVLDWWPIKAYRPCPQYIDRGGFYQRSGQGLDEIAFGRDSKYDGGQ